MPDDADTPAPSPVPSAVEGAGEPEGDSPEEARRTLDRVTGQLEWVQERLDQLDAAAAAAAEAMGERSG